MEKLLSSLLRTARSLLAPGMLRLFLKTMLLSLIVLLWFILFSSLAVSWLSHNLQGQAAANYLPWLGSIGGTMIAWILFPAIMPVIVKCFDAQVVLMIEEETYPDTKQLPSAPFWPDFLQDMRFSCMAILLNLLVLPLYMLPVLNLVLFYLLNGYLLGHEFFRMAARRHVPAHEIQQLCQRYAAVIILAGIVLTLIATIPVINVLAPFLSIAFMVHLYHRLDRRLTVEFVSAD